MILGLDISSSVVGISVLFPNGKLYVTHYIDLRTTTKAKKEKFQDLYDKLIHCVEYLENLKYSLGDNKITQIHIEEALSKFQAGRSSIHTLAVLFKMNHALSFELYQIFGVKPQHWNPISVRKINGLKIIKGKDVKQQVLKFACSVYPEFAKSLPENLPKINPWLDVADSLLIARVGAVHGSAKKNN